LAWNKFSGIINSLDGTPVERLEAWCFQLSAGSSRQAASCGHYVRARTLFAVCFYLDCSKDRPKDQIENSTKYELGVSYGGALPYGTY